MNKRIILLIGATVLGLGIGITIFFLKFSSSRQITYSECVNAGGVIWWVDLYHPEICPACAEFRDCEMAYDDYRAVCPDCYGPCQECQEQYSVEESCPECYGPCQACANQYLNDFESEEERDRLCPECKACEICREEIDRKKINCPPCVSCNACKEENKRYTDIRDVCPQVVACTECMESNFPYPDRCPDGREKIGEISDTALWSLCCK